MPTMPRIEEGTVLRDRYQLEAQIGAGSMGRVFRAHDRHTGLPVAVKVLAPELAEEAVHVERFRREALAAGQLHHPSVVRVHMFEQEGSTFFLVMDLLEGLSLGEIMRREGALDAGRVVRMAHDVLSGLEVAHRAGLIHRDLKPQNLVLVPGPDGTESTVLVDFGVVKLQHSTNFARLTASGTFIGTPGYASPEQLKALPVDFRADLYSLGCMMFEALSGRHPFAARSTPELLRRIVMNEHPPLDALRPALDPALVHLIHRALESDPRDRPESARAMAEALAELDVARVSHVEPLGRAEPDDALASVDLPAE